jgi:hypothetical protein
MKWDVFSTELPWTNELRGYEVGMIHGKTVTGFRISGRSQKKITALLGTEISSKWRSTGN